MRPVVRERWLAFTEPLEGGLNYLYADVLGLVTTGYGNLVDPLSHAIGLDWAHPGGKLATASEVSAAWWRIKNDPLCRSRGHLYARGLTTLRLTPSGLQKLVYGKLAANDAVLRGRVQDWEEHPACAQMAVHSLAWACGPHFRFPRLIEAMNARDYDAASVHVHMNEWSGTVHNRGLIPRNVANKILLRNAARVRDFKLDPDLLDWMHDLSVADEPTLPELPQLLTPIMTHAASLPTQYPSPGSEAETGSGGIIHPFRYPLEDDPDDAA